MKTNDLRLGNYLRLRDTQQIVEVCAITKHKVGFHAPNERPNAQLRYRRISELEPILIFEVKDKLPYLPRLKWADLSDKDLYYYSNIPLYDLHELQNIHYSLTGNEIKIEI